MAQKFYLTTPIYYVNARPHIGHAYTTIVADVLARRHRLLGDDTYFLTGTDEHGQKIERSAAAAGIPPQQFADQVSQSFRDLWARMGITNDDYIRTTDPRHTRGVQKLFATLYERGQIYLDSYTGAYCVSDEAFVDAPVGTPCPDCGRLLEQVTEENFFFRLSDYQLPLLNLIESNELLITPDSRRNEVLSFLRGPIGQEPGGPSFAPFAKGGVSDEVRPSSAQPALTALGTPYLPGALKDLSVSRSSFTWGIPVPEPAASEAKEKHVIYVWLDALANYMTAIGYGSDDPIDVEKFNKYWPADLHLVGKEIIRFHCVYWPAFLLAAGLPLPKAITAHGWLLFDDSKMSKSKGNIVRTETILDAFGTLCPPPPPAPSSQPAPSLLSSRSEAEGSASPSEPSMPSAHDRDLFAADILRYFLLREIPFGQDGSFSFDALITRYNADLANGYGNLVSRTLSLIAKYQDGTIVVPADSWVYGGEIALVPDSKIDLLAQRLVETPAVIEGIKSMRGVEENFNTLRFDLSTVAISSLIKIVDIYLSSHAPWNLAKSENDEDQRGLVEVLYTAAESIRIITALLYPILPYATANVWRQLGLGDIEAAAKSGELTNLQWGGLKPGTKLGPLSPIFPRADKGLATIMANMESPSLSAITDNNDATHPASDDLPTGPIASEAPKSKLVDETFVQSPAPTTTFDPAAGPRTTTLAEPSPGDQVAGSTATTTERELPPAHNSELTTSNSPQISIDDFIKIDLRVAKILVAERIPKADKLLRLEVDLGYETRQILSGIAEFYTPEELIGRRIVVIANLAPRKMRGLESHGMLLAASAEGGKPILATFPETEELPLGSRLK